MSIVYLNGDFLPAEEASISPLDRGFIFGDGVYEVIPVYNGQLFRLPEHLDRLDNSLAGIRIEHPFNHQQWQEVLNQLIQKNGGGNQSLYLQITRGVAQRDHAFPENSSPTVFAMCNPLKPISDKIKNEGISAITLDDIRWRYCHLKTIALLPNILMRQRANEAHADEAILVKDDRVTEGAASNVFIVTDSTIITPPKGQYLLPGITRDLILELALQNQINAVEKDITINDLDSADEIWLSSSTKEILPVTQLNQRAVGSSRPGPMWQKMLSLYQDFKRDYRA
ncbi:MAG: D-amino acid aminotransferase [Gammaproteobacteria bacterium]